MLFAHMTALPSRSVSGLERSWPSLRVTNVDVLFISVLGEQLISTCNMPLQVDQHNNRTATNILLQLRARVYLESS